MLILRARLAGEALLDELKEKRIELAVLGHHHKRTRNRTQLPGQARSLLPDHEHSAVQLTRA